MDSIQKLELLLNQFTRVVNYVSQIKPELITPRDQQHCEPFVGQEGEFNIHDIIFDYSSINLLDEEYLQLNQGQAISGLVALSLYADVIESSLDDIFVDEELLNRFEWFPSKVSFDKLREALQLANIRKRCHPFRINIVEGYIGEGKSQLLKAKNTFDSELDYFYRAKIKPNSLGFEYMPEIFFRVFALLGIYGSFANSLINGAELFIDRSWLSHEYFAKHLVSRYRNVVKYSPPETFGKLDKKFFSNLFLWPWLFRDNGLRNYETRHLKEKVSFYFRQTPIEYPWPLMEHRQMEMDVYKTEADLVVHYKQFYLYLNKYFMKCALNW